MTATLTVVVPTRHAAGHLGAMLDRLMSAVPTDTSVIVVDDASEDRTWDTIEAVAGDRVAGIRLERRVGQYRATLHGLRAVESPVAMTLDDDIVLEATDTTSLTEPVLSGRADLVYGPWREEGTSRLRAARSLAIRSAGDRIGGWSGARGTSSIRCLRTELVAGVEGGRHGERMDLELGRRANSVEVVDFRRTVVDRDVPSRYSRGHRWAQVLQYTTAVLGPDRWSRATADIGADVRVGWLADRE